MSNGWYLILVPFVVGIVVVPRYVRRRFPGRELVTQSLINSVMIGSVMVAVTVYELIQRDWIVALLAGIAAACFSGIAIRLMASGRARSTDDQWS